MFKKRTHIASGYQFSLRRKLIKIVDNYFFFSPLPLYHVAKYTTKILITTHTRRRQQGMFDIFVARLHLCNGVQIFCICETFHDKLCARRTIEPSGDNIVWYFRTYVHVAVLFHLNDRHYRFAATKTVAVAVVTFVWLSVRHFIRNFSRIPYLYSIFNSGINVYNLGNEIVAALNTIQEKAAIYVRWIR